MSKPELAQQPRVIYMTESGVKEIVSTEFKNYERDIAGPRNQETNAKLDEVLDVLTFVRGGIAVIKNLMRWIGGTLTAVYAAVKIFQAVKGHL